MKQIVKIILKNETEKIEHLKQIIDNKRFVLKSKQILIARLKTEITYLIIALYLRIK